jgi:hypothetical protein
VARLGLTFAGGRAFSDAANVALELMKRLEGEVLEGISGDQGKTFALRRA